MPYIINRTLLGSAIKFERVISLNGKYRSDATVRINQHWQSPWRKYFAWCRYIWKFIRMYHRLPSNEDPRLCVFWSLDAWTIDQSSSDQIPDLVIAWIANSGCESRASLSANKLSTIWSFKLRMEKWILTCMHVFSFKIIAHDFHYIVVDFTSNQPNKL